MKKYSLIAIMGILAPTLLYSQPISERTLAKWKLLGIGEVAIDNSSDSVQLTESNNSKGAMLLSNNMFPKNSVLKFEVKPLSANGVLVVLISASGAQTDGEISVPDNYDGNWEFWKSQESTVQSYAFAFHTRFHQPYAFVKRNPGFREIQKNFDLATSENWNAVEISRNQGTLTLKINGRTVLEEEDTGPELPKGFIAFRIRGPGDGSFSALYRNVTVEAL